MTRLIIFLFIIFYNVCSFAGAYIKDKNELLLIFENTTTSNKLNLLSSVDTNKDFRSSENKFYFEYGLGNNFALNGYIKSLDLKVNFDTKSKNRSDSNYFYNFGLQYNFINKNNNYLTANFWFYDGLKVDKVLFITSNNDIFTAFEYGISYAYFFDGFIGTNNSNFLNIDVKYKYLKNTFKDNFNTSISLGRKINSTSMIILEYLYSQDIIKNENFLIDKYFYDGNQTLTPQSRKNKIKNSLSSTYHTIKLSSITNFTENFSFKIGIENSFYKNNKKSYAITSGFWFNFR